jgi:hypothetical protein
VLLLVKVFLLETFLLSGNETLAVGTQEGLEISEEVLLSDEQVPVEEEEELAFHEIDLGEREAKIVVSPHCGITGPMFVFGAGVIKLLGGKYERSKENAVDSAAHALGDWRQTRTQTTEIDQTAHESGYLHLRPSDK